MSDMIRMGKVETYINDKIASEGAILLSLVDPDKQADKCAEVARTSAEAGADIILVGGSIGAQGEPLDNAVKAIKEAVNVPVVLFPGSVGGVSQYADATYFMYMMNSRDLYWVTGAQIQGAPVVKRSGVEPIPTGYIVIEPGMAVGWVGNANLVPRSRPDLAAATALAAQYMGARLVVTDSGSGAPTPAPVSLVSAVAKTIDIPYFYGGGCRTPEQAAEIVRAGADGIQIGTAFEVTDDLKPHVERIVRAMKEEGKKRV